ncbi:MAG: DUF4124 domain-containing protein [Halofilum sp. (in: g-proteobacteria)]
MKRLIVIFLPVALAAGPVAASEIYRTTDADGNVVFTDEPPSDDAEPLELDPLTTVEPIQGDPDGAATTSSATPEDEPGTPSNGISGISIAYPGNEKGIRHNGGNVPFEVALQPEGATLPRGHQVELVLDGEPRARAASTQVTVSPVERGPHTVRARIIDKAGKVRYESESVKFYLLRKALGGSDGN